MRKYLRIANFVDEKKCYLIISKMLHKNLIFKNRCMTCFEKTKQYIWFYKITSIYGIGNFVVYNYVERKCCISCLFCIEKNEWQDLWETFVYKNYIFKSKCKICNKRYKNTIRFNVGLLNKGICKDCWCTHNNIQLSEEESKKCKELINMLFIHNPYAEYKKIKCNCDESKQCIAKCKCSCHKKCNCYDCDSQCLCLCHSIKK